MRRHEARAARLGAALSIAALMLTGCGAGADGVLKATGGLTKDAASTPGQAPGPSPDPTATADATGIADASGTADAAGSANSGGAYPATGSAPEQAPFNPFATPGGPIPGGREVIANPTVADVMEPGPLPEMALGRSEAPVTIVQYASLTCPHCRRFHAEVFPELKRAYIDTGKVRYILREFPIGKASGNATIALRCAQPARYFDLYGRFMAQQPSWVSQEVRIDAIFAVAAQSGLKRAEFDACLQNQALIDSLKWVKERGRKLGVIGTPNFFINGRRVKSTVGLPELRDLVEPLLAAPASGAAPAGRAAPVGSPAKAG